MPLYEYQCESCGHRFEVIQKFSDAPVATCQKCGGPVQKLLSSPAIQFKGSGWYITDYARSGKSDGGGTPAAKSGGSGNAASEGGSSDSSSSSAPATDAKPAAATSSKE
jgi:putative FmdB family regulatory protein